MLNTSASPSKNSDKKEMVKRKRKQQEWQMQISCVIRKRKNLNLFNPFWQDPHNLIVGAASTRHFHSFLTHSYSFSTHSYHLRLMSSPHPPTHTHIFRVIRVYRLYALIIYVFTCLTYVRAYVCAFAFYKPWCINNQYAFVRFTNLSILTINERMCVLQTLVY